MKSHKAIIHWKRYDEGGRSTQLSNGVRYFPNIVLDNDPDEAYWSVVFRVAPTDQHGWSTVDLELLADAEEALRFESRFSPNITFSLREGKMIVATGRFI